MRDAVDQILPPATIGVMGGGQLGRFFVHAAQDLGYRVWVLDPDPDSPAGRAADRHVVAPYDDPAALELMAAGCAAVTTEFENVPTESMARLQQGTRVRPGPDAVAVSQDRAVEKAFLNRHGFATAPWVPVDGPDALDSVPDEHFPAVLKTSRNGYDGKGQVRVRDRAEAREAHASLGAPACVLEKLVPLEGEVAVVLARDASGAVETFDAVRTLHVDGILARASLGDLPAPRSERARVLAAGVAEALSYVGVLAVEMFVVGGELLVNELAPRPHNSGHLTLDAHAVSQFEYQVRTLCGLPLVPCAARADAVMVNLLGDLWCTPGGATEPPWGDLLAVPGLALHLYGKATPRPGRKMGHFTLVGTPVEELHRRADEVVAELAARVTPAADGSPATPPTDGP
jgi:5-(carboxyamino)imidazole ribonucleotide synthase